MAKSKINLGLQVPIRDEGEIRHHLSYPEYWGEGLGILDSPQPFKASMRVTGSHRGRSAAQMAWEDIETKYTYCMFLNSMYKMLKDLSMENGVVTGWWYFVKRGANYGIEYSATEPK